MVAVGHAIRNRMPRTGAAGVDEAWGGYRHGARASDEPGRFELAKQVAAGIIDGTTADAAGGATHHYSPQGRTTAPVPAPGQGNKAGFETVPGVIDRESRQPGQNTFPDWSRSSDFEARPMPAIPERAFKFYRQRRKGRVR